MSNKYKKKLQKQLRSKKAQKKQRAKVDAQRRNTMYGYGEQDDLVAYRKMTEHMMFMQEVLADPDAARAMGFSWPDDIGPRATEGYAEIVQAMKPLWDAGARFAEDISGREQYSFRH